jgi:hypothetical protein
MIRSLRHMRRPIWRVGEALRWRRLVAEAPQADGRGERERASRVALVSCSVRSENRILGDTNGSR